MVGIAASKGPHPALRATFSKEKGQFPNIVPSPWRGGTHCEAMGGEVLS